MSSFYWGVPKITIICYCSWDMQCDRHNFLSFWPFLALLPQYWCRKLKFSKNIKNWIYSPFTHVYHNWRSYDVLFLRFKARKSFLSFWAIFCPLTLLTTWKIKILKKILKKAPKILFYTCVPQMTIIWCMVLQIWSMTGRTFLSL